MSDNNIRKEQINNGENIVFKDEPINLGEQTIETTGAVTAGSVAATGAVTVADEAYGSGWNGSTEVPTKNAVYDKIETILVSAGVASVNGETGVVTLDTGDIAEVTNLYYTDERAQDAVGAMIDTTLVYTDGTPLLSRAAISGDITMSAGSNTAAITTGSIINTDISSGAAIALSKLATGALPTAITIASANLVDGTIVNADINASAAIDATKIGTGVVTSTEFGYIGGLTSDAQTQITARVSLTGNETITGIKTFGSIPVLPASDPTTANQSVRKSYVDAGLAGVNPALRKASCDLATTGNITLSGEQTIDGTLTNNSRVLVKDQTTVPDNGIYITTSGAWARASDYDTAAEIKQGNSMFVTGGTTNIKTQWFVISADVASLGADDIVFTQAFSPANYNPGDGINFTSNTISFDNSYLGTAITNGGVSSVGADLSYNTGTNTLDVIVDESYLNTNLTFAKKSGSFTEGEILASDSTTGTMKVSGLKYSSNTLEPTAQSTFTVQPATRTTNGTGYTATIKGGSSLQSSSPAKTGGNLVLSPGDSWNNGNLIGAKIQLNAPSTTFPYSSSVNVTLPGDANSGYLILNCVSSSAELYLSLSGIPTTAHPSVVLTGHTPGVIVADKVYTLTDGATVTLPSNFGNIFSLTSSGDRTISVPTGTPHDGQKIVIKHIASGADRTLSLTTTAGGFRFSSFVTSLTATLSGSTDYITAIYNSADSYWDVIDVSKGSSTSPGDRADVALPSDIQIFTSSGTWTKPAGAKSVLVQLIGGGGGGGSGRKGAVSTVRCAGGGGAGAGIAYMTFDASVLGSTETVTVGTGGAGGASRTTNDTSGANGSNGTPTTFGVWLKAGSGLSGSGGTLTSGIGGGTSTNGFPNVSGQTAGGTGGSGGTTGGIGTTPSGTTMSPAGGASGGGITSANVANTGAAGAQVGSVSNNSGGYAVAINGGTLGAVNTNGGNGTASPTNSIIGGAGGGGGGASTTTNAGAGGNGGLYGAGGGGGGAATNAVGNSGAGGNGAGGIAIITTYF